MLSNLDLDHQHVAEALSEHLTARLAALDRNLRDIESFWPRVPRDVTLRIVQLAPEEPDDAEEGPLEDFWRRPVPVTETVLQEWRAAALRVRDLRPAHEALSVFAEIEDRVAKLEEPVDRFLEEFDRMVQQEIDLRRGK